MTVSELIDILSQFPRGFQVVTSHNGQTSEITPERINAFEQSIVIHGAATGKAAKPAPTKPKQVKKK